MLNEIPIDEAFDALPLLQERKEEGIDAFEAEEFLPILQGEMPQEIPANKASKYLRVLQMQKRPQAQSGKVAAVSSAIGTLMAPKDQPIAGTITQNFDTRVNYTKSGRHGGLDIAAATGTPIPSKVAGTVVSVEDQGKRDYGRTVLVKGEDGITRRYGHLDKFNVKPGQTIKPGQIIGTVGNTGRSTGSHLHYEEAK